MNRLKYKIGLKAISQTLINEIVTKYAHMVSCTCDIISEKILFWKQTNIFAGAWQRFCNLIAKITFYPAGPFLSDFVTNMQSFICYCLIFYSFWRGCSFSPFLQCADSKLIQYACVLLKWFLYFNKHNLCITCKLLSRDFVTLKTFFLNSYNETEIWFWSLSMRV